MIYLLTYIFFTYYCFLFHPKVYTRISYYNGGLSGALFNITGAQGDFWYRGIATVNNANADYQFVIEGVRGNSYQGDIAIDDVSMTPGCKICTNCVMPGLLFALVVSLNNQ